MPLQALRCFCFVLIPNACCGANDKARSPTPTMPDVRIILGFSCAMPRMDARTVQTLIKTGETEEMGGTSSRVPSGECLSILVHSAAASMIESINPMCVVLQYYPQSSQHYFGRSEVKTTADGIGHQHGSYDKRWLVEVCSPHGYQRGS